MSLRSLDSVGGGCLSRDEWSSVIRMLRPILITLMCLAHLPNVRGYLSDFDQFNQPLTLFPIFVKDILARGAVPLLTVVSGYLACFSYMRRDYISFILGKVKRILLPLIVWNLIAALAYWSYYQLFYFNFMSITKVDDLSALLQGVFGIHRLPINAPTYFLRDLFLLLMVVPIIHLVCRRSLLCIPVVVVLMWFFGGQGVSLSWEQGTLVLLNRSDMLVFFMVGYYFSWRNVTPFKLARFESYMVLLMTLAALALLSVIVSAINPSQTFFAQLCTFIGVLWVLLLPAVASVLWHERLSVLGGWLQFLSPYAFTLFLSHHISALVYSAILSRAFGVLVNERSPIWQIALYMVAYSVFLWCVAIVILRAWRGLLNLLPVKSRLVSS